MELNPSLHDVDSCPSYKIELVVQVVRQVQIEGNEASISFHELSARVDSAEYKVQFSTNLKNVPLFEIWGKKTQQKWLHVNKNPY